MMWSEEETFDKRANHMIGTSASARFRKPRQAQQSWPAMDYRACQGQQARLPSWGRGGAPRRSSTNKQRMWQSATVGVRERVALGHLPERVGHLRERVALEYLPEKVGHFRERVALEYLPERMGHLRKRVALEYLPEKVGHLRERVALPVQSLGHDFSNRAENPHHLLRQYFIGNIVVSIVIFMFMKDWNMNIHQFILRDNTPSFWREFIDIFVIMFVLFLIRVIISGEDFRQILVSEAGRSDVIRSVFSIFYDLFLFLKKFLEILFFCLRLLVCAVLLLLVSLLNRMI